MSVYSRTLRYFRPFVWPTLGGLAAMLVAIGLNVLRPWPFKLIIDGVLSGETNEATLHAKEVLVEWFGPEASTSTILMWLCLALVLIVLCWGIVNLVSNYLFIRTGLKAMLKLRTDLYACLQALPLRFHDARRSTDSSFRVAYDSQSIQTIYNKGFATVINSVITLATMAVVMAWIDWRLTLASLGILPFVFIAIRYYAERIRRESTAIQEKESDVLAVAQEGLSSIRLVHAFGRERYEVSQFYGRASESLEANLRFNITSVTSALVIGTLMAAGTAAMYYVGSRQMLAGELSFGDLILFASYLIMLYQPLEQLSYTAWALEGAAAGMTRCFEVMDREPEGHDEPGAIELPPVSGRVEFRDVAFGYSEDQQILSGIDLAIEAGEKIAFVGGTGAGKSTLLSLLLRFYEPSRGAVFVDGHDVKDATRRSLRSQIGMVLQDTVLFSSTIRENIAYGRPGATDEEIREAARRAQAIDFIEKLPRGFDNLVGERGGHLSVGQRQRIGIARAFLKDAPIMLLDEPTSALDPATEFAIMETLEELMAGRTALIVTHRLATVHQFGKIAVLKDGRIVEFGAGPELLAKGGAYADLWRAGQYEV